MTLYRSGAVRFAVMHNTARRYRLTFVWTSVARCWRARSQQKRAPLPAADDVRGGTHITGSALLPSPQEFEPALRSPIMDQDQTRGPVICHGLRHRPSVWPLDHSRQAFQSPAVGDFAQADVLVEGKTILAIAPHVPAGTADVIDASGRIVMPGFIDTHHHQFETALRSFLADGVLINDQTGTPSGNTTYFEYVLLTFAPVYRPQDVYINELFAGLTQLDDGVTTVHDVSQIHYSPDHSDAAVQALFDTGRRAAFGYFEGAGQGIIPSPAGYAYPQDAYRLHNKYFRSTDQLVTMIMGGEVYIGEPTYTKAWSIGRDLGLQVAAHILSPFGIRPTLDALADGTGGNNTITGKPLTVGPDNLFIHMTGMSDKGWKAVHDNGAQVSIAFPIEMNMRHGTPPIVRMQTMSTAQHPFEPSLSVDVECTLTADFFTQMRSAINLQRMIVNQMILDSPNSAPGSNLPNPLDWGLPQTGALVSGGTFPPIGPPPSPHRRCPAAFRRR